MRYVLLGALIALAGCGAGVHSTPQTVLPSTYTANVISKTTESGKIRHVVYVVQEGRSFDDLFAGYPGADTASSGYTSSGIKVKLAPISLKARYDIDTTATAMFVSCNGTGQLPGTSCRMDGFNEEQAFGGPKHVKYPMYAYVPHDESKPYFDMAHEWVVADNMFASQLDGSFTAHQYIVAAQSGRAVGIPDGKWGCGGGSQDQIETLTEQRGFGPNEGACFKYVTLANELEKARLSWRYYTADKATSSFAFDKRVYGTPQWRKDVIAPSSKFLTDLGRGKLATVTWITPSCADSDAVECGAGGGPAWVSSLVNAVGKSKFWNSTAIFVQWDDWGGFYDPVAPPYENFDGLGFRLPLLVISPYAKQNYVSHVQYETAGVLRFIEDDFGLKQMAAADRRATSPAADCFDFSQPPRKFVPIKG